MSFALRKLLIVAALGGTLGCSHSSDKEEAGVDHQRSTGGLQLSHDKKSAIGLVTQEVRRRSVEDSMTATGWLMVKPGHEVIVKASATGFVLPVEEKKSEAAHRPPVKEKNCPLELGAAVSDEQTLGSLRIFLSPQEEAQLVALKEEADILIRQSLVTVRRAEEQYELAKNAEDAIAGKDIQALQEILDRSRAAYEEAHDKLPFLPPEPYERPLKLQAIEIKSPMVGRITELHVRPRQLVVQGDPLWTIADWSTLWVKVPIFEGALPRIDKEASIHITGPGIKTPITARPTGIPQSTNAGRRTVDVMYEVDNSSGNLRPGQAVSVSLPTGRSIERLIVPQTAIVWDGMHNAWVYVEESEDRYLRRRVQLGQMIDDHVVVEEGLVEGTKIVTVGAESLHGEEFKGQIQMGDDD